MQLGPGLCVARIPRNGRNFEYISGEEPYLGYVLAKAAITGIQSQGVIANAKHFAMNRSVPSHPPGPPFQTETPIRPKFKEIRGFRYISNNRAARNGRGNNRKILGAPAR